MSDVLTKFDAWLKEAGPAALVVREHLVPVEGSDGVCFPATFAAAEDKSVFNGGYNIDRFPDGRNICLIDSVGSQANRIEPMFARDPYARLVPQIIVRAGEKTVNLLDAGHRAGDAIVRCSALQQELRNAFLAVLNGDDEPLAKIAPTSLVFGVWDSRDTHAKHPRLVAATIRAFDVRELTRSAQFVPALEYVGEELLEEPGDKAQKSAYAERGFSHVPAAASHGGVIAVGGIRRDATLSLSGLRLLAAGENAERSLPLQRYILGLALTAFTRLPLGHLRQGCNLVLDSEKPREFVEVSYEGGRSLVSVTHDMALSYALQAADAFGVGENREVDFEKSLAHKDLGLAPADEEKSKKGRNAKK